ncbi:hypothetical protein DCAR_0100947 [Daucus carota subsp. sativus]|uniref:Uncharacterized protein n=1 Tax=Daucus carota subsp. sativus TaxID=79200 RepID=A0A166G235_DAUCS|nr:hypothetical protein DCAR_0100947 [Daucus carota subsp. sativus]
MTMKYYVLKLVSLLLMALMFYIEGAFGSTPPCCFYDPDCCQRTLRLAGMNVVVPNLKPPPLQT